MNRRGLLLGLGSLIAAPAIVRVTSLMPVKLVDWDAGNRIITMNEWAARINEGYAIGYAEMLKQYHEMFRTLPYESGGLNYADVDRFRARP